MSVVPDFWKGKRIWLSGHTGFMGSWLALWLKEMGAQVYGFSLEAKEGSLFQTLEFESLIDGHLIGDIRHLPSVASSFYVAQPDIVFHLAGLEPSLHTPQQPRSMWETHVMGTLNVLDIAQSIPSIKVIQLITSDACYEHLPPFSPRLEDHPLGGSDSYGGSKAAAEFVARSYIPALQAQEKSLATCRTGNIIGPGDYSSDRFIPSAIQALHRESPIPLRYPQAVRGWQVILDALYGFLKLAEVQWQQPLGFSGAWNFAPPADRLYTATQWAEGLQRHWSKPTTLNIDIQPDAPWYPYASPALDSMKAWGCLGWMPRFDFEEAVRWVTQGYEQSLYASPTEFLQWIRASILSYGVLEYAVPELNLDDHYWQSNPTPLSPGKSAIL
jgi:CDP-glucose 4,6-dehydratase